MNGDQATMNLDAVRSIANAVLYEGYILYPYRASSQKNQSRWQWGVVMAPGYAAADPSERSFTLAECVLAHTGQPVVQVVLRFLQVQRRTTEGSGQGWDEAVEREIEVTADTEALFGDGVVEEFAIAGGQDREPLDEPGGTDGTGPRYAVRRREPLAGTVSVRAIGVPGPWRAVRLQVRVENRTVVSPVPQRREDALPSALIAAHTIISVSGGEFISMTDPPIWAQPAVAECQNEGGWPVLADPGGGRQVVLSSPIILYDHPELAAESPGELYDGTEIDEILTLRTLALSDAEKTEARATDPRAAALLDRVESMDAETMARLHGTIRSLRPATAGQPGSISRPGAIGDPGTMSQPGSFGQPGGFSQPGPADQPGAEPSVPWWDPDADASVSPDTDTVTIGGQQIGRGSRVRLRPGARRADAQDMFLIGRMAEVQAVLHDVDDKPYLAVTLADDPDEDIRIAHGRFLYFSTDEVEPGEPGAEGSA
jgi:hypothetical protein